MTTDRRATDVAILGAGTAGITARRAVQKAGKSVLMIDPGPFGTTCARVGCMPSKLLIAAADAAHQVEHAATFGIHPGPVRIDGREVLGRVQSERDRFVGFVEDVIEEARQAGELLVGRATIVGPGRLMVDQCEVRYQSLIIATGVRPVVPRPFRAVESALLTNEDIFELDDLPGSLLVVGLGVLGIELGQAFHRLGVRTTLVGVDGDIGPIRDPEVLAAARSIFGKELDLHPDYQLEHIEPHDQGVRMKFVDSHGASRTETFERVLMAAGRKPNLDSLGLDSIGIEPNEHGVYPIAAQTLQLADQPVFVAGDANGLHPLLHEATDDGRIAGNNAANYPEIRAAVRRCPLAIVFTDPQIAIVNNGYQVLDECEAVVGKVDFSKQGRARVHAANRGLARLYAEKSSGQFVGAELVGPRAEHMAHLLAWAVQQKLTVEDMLAMPIYHPVIEEGLRSALRDTLANLRHGKPIKCPVSELGVGA